MVKENIMKRYKYILFVLFSILACQSEIDQNENTNENAIPMSFYAGIEIPKDPILTKTVLDGSPSDAFRNVLWEYQDEVYVTNGSQSAKFINTSQGTSEIALLEGQLAEGANYFAAYPFNIVTNSSLSSITVDLPSEQRYCADGIESEAFPMVAQCEEGVFNFKNICGILVVQLLGDETVSSVTFSGKDSDGNSIPVSGTGTVSMSYSDVPTLVMNNSSNTSVSLSSSTGIKLNSTTPTSFHIVLPPGVYNTFELVITAEDGSQMMLNSDKILTVRRSIRTTTSPMNFSPSFLCYIDEYGVNHGTGVMIGETVWAPVNCGYHETDFRYGKLYQWGRKYGQGYDGALYDVNGDKIGTYSDSSVPTIKSESAILSEGLSKSNENYFYITSSIRDYDWLSSPNNKLWNSGTEENPIRTEYDPCPEGWRVPTYAELDELISNYSSWTTDKNGQAGYWFCGESSYTEIVQSIFLPAAGMRTYSGNAGNLGRMGSYWSSKSSDYHVSAGYGDFACAFDFSDGYLYIGSDYRSSGYSIRCVQE